MVLLIGMAACSDNHNAIVDADDGVDARAGVDAPGGTDARDVASVVPVACSASNTSVAPSSGLIADFTSAGSNPGDLGLNLPGGISTWSSAGTGAPGGPTFTTNGSALQIAVDVPSKSATQYIGTFLYFDGCVDASAFAGVQFNLSGSLSGCTLQYATADDGHQAATGTWPIASGPAGSYPMQHSIANTRLTSMPQTIKAPFNGGNIQGSPSTPMDPGKLIFIMWQFTVPSAPSGTSPPPRCTGQITVDDIRFYGRSGGPVVVSAAAPAPREATLSVNYWQWMPTYGDGTSGTESRIAALKPSFLRIGGYNNDAKRGDPFDHAALDRAVAYARAIGADPIVQVPLVADSSGQPPTAAYAADLVAYANVTQGYGIKYFSVGNEPDLYASQGQPQDPERPAIPGYRPSDYCASARSYVAAMKAADPAIKIIGPDLSWKYQAGTSSNDWLSPILKECGDLFDIVSIHRYPFSASASTLALASGDAAAFATVVAGVRDIMRLSGHGPKPLAVMEMNVAYDQTLCVLDASPGTLGAALWLADNLGTSMDLGLWTTALWDIADTDDWALGLLGMPPDRTPRPSYWAYSMVADHFGPTLVAVTDTPLGVSAHASRNQANDATQIVAINWNHAATTVPFQVTGLAQSTATTLVLPPTSIVALELADDSTARAWTYGEAQRSAGLGPQRLGDGPPDGGVDEPDGGTARSGAGKVPGVGCPSDAGPGVCPAVTLPTPIVTIDGKSDGNLQTFGTGVYKWNSYTWANPGQTAPTMQITADGNGIAIAGSITTPSDGSDNRYTGAGLYFAGAVCVDASKFTGVEFDFAGDLGGCDLYFGASATNDILPSDFRWGTCTAPLCYGPSAPVDPAATVRVPFASLSLGMPVPTLDPTSLHGIQWTLGAPAGSANGSTCAAGFTVSNVAFY